MIKFGVTLIIGSWLSLEANLDCIIYPHDIQSTTWKAYPPSPLTPPGTKCYPAAYTCTFSPKRTSTGQSVWWTSHDRNPAPFPKPRLKSSPAHSALTNSPTTKYNFLSTANHSKPSCPLKASIAIRIPSSLPSKTAACRKKIPRNTLQPWAKPPKHLKTNSRLPLCTNYSKPMIKNPPLETIKPII